MSYPYRNPRVAMDIPQPVPDSRLILNHETGRYLRLGLREFDWLGRLDGHLHANDVPTALGLEAALAQELLKRFAAARLICFSDEPVRLQAIDQPQPSRLAARRVEWTQFGQLRIHLGNPAALLATLAPVTDRLMSRPFVAAGLFLALCGLALGLSETTELGRVVREFPWRVGQTAAIVALLFATTAVHELGHAAACAHFGAPVRGLGVMIYYLQPAAYADVTDSWQLKNPLNRVAIASAGVYVQAVITGAAVVLWTLVRMRGGRADLLVMFIVLNATLVVFNALPFIRLDGYWVLTNLLGIGNLRDRAMEWSRVSLVSTLTRRPVVRQQLRYNAVLAMSPLGRILLACFGITTTLFGLSMWIGGVGFLFRLTRWLGMPQQTRALAVGGMLAALAAAYGGRFLIARRKARRPQPPAVAERRAPAVRAVVTHAIDRHRPIRLNPHVPVMENADGTLTFAWSTPDALTLPASARVFDALPRLREGTATLDGLKQSDVWSPQFELAMQRLWHERHLRYASEWDLPEPAVRYARQLGWFSLNTAARGKELDALARLENASVTVLGVGGLGTHVAWNLAACGVGELHLVDGDLVELTNLNRQLFYTPQDVGCPKVEVAAARLRDFNPQIRIRTEHRYVNSLNDVLDAIAGSAFVVRAIDSPPESLGWVNEACIALGIPYCGAGFFAQGTIVGPTVVPGESACLACSAPAVTPRFDRGTGGTLAPLVAITAGVLAADAINYVGRLGPLQTKGRMLAINAPALSFTFRDAPRNDACRVCGPQRHKVSA